jgi:hypothetical protein
MRFSRISLFSYLVLFLSLVISACRKPGPQSIIRMSDLHTQKQLLRGFYDLESGAWRWTQKAFTVALKVPSDGATKGAVLTLQGSVQPGSLQNGPLEISSVVGGTALPSKTVSKAGELIYRADVPPSALAQQVVLVDFTLSNTHRVPGDARDLGIIASVISLRSK